MNIYQIFTRLYGNPCTHNLPNGTLIENGSAKFNDFTTVRLLRMKEYGFSHLWFTGVIEHATQTDYTQQGIAKDHPAVVKGKAGSPYAIKDYYDVDPDLAVCVEQRMDEFESLVQRVHQVGLKMIIDFVPNHVARQYRSDAASQDVEDLGARDDVQQHFSTSNDFYYCWGETLHTDNFAQPRLEEYPYLECPAKATGNDKFDAWPSRNDWYETIKLNYGIDYCGGGTRHFSPRPSVWGKMLNILRFWAGKGVDGFRCDMAEMVPVEFWHYAIGEMKREFPHILFIAEVYNPSEYRNYLHHGRFDYLYDKVGLYDTLRAIIRHEAPAAAVTGAWQSTDDIRSHMLYFLENHDEQRIASDYFAGDAYKALPALAIAAFLGNNPLMIYAGQELGECGMDEEGFSGRDGRTTIFDYWCPASLHKLAALPTENRLTEEENHLYEEYKRILTLRQESIALREGAFYDLMYANYDWVAQFNPDRLYAFLRHAEGETVLVVANFADEAIQCGIRIPAHAFEHLGLTEGEYMATDLHRQTLIPLSLHRDQHSHVHVPACSYLALSFSSL